MYSMRWAVWIRTALDTDSAIIYFHPFPNVYIHINNVCVQAHFLARGATPDALRLRVAIMQRESIEDKIERYEG